MHSIEAVRGAQKVIGRFGTTTNARELGHTVRLNIELPTSLNDRRRDRVMAAAGAQGGDAALVIAAGIANLVGNERRVMQLGFGEVGHAASVCKFSLMAWVIKRAVMGVPS